MEETNAVCSSRVLFLTLASVYEPFTISYMVEMGYNLLQGCPHIQ